MWNVSNDFKEKVTDGHSRQDFRIYDLSPMSAGYTPTFGNQYISWNDGEFSSEGIEIKRAVNEATDLTFGECPSATINFKLIDRYNDLIEFWTRSTAQSHNTYLWGQAYIGVLIDSEPYVLEDGVNVEVTATVGDDTITLTGKDDGLYINGTLSNVTTEKVLGITLDYRNSGASAYFNATIYCETGVRSIYMYADGTVSLNVDGSGTYPPFMRRKNQYRGYFRNTYAGNSYPTYAFVDGKKETWEWCPVGRYKLFRPRDLWNVELEIKDGYDKMAEFDVGLYDAYTSMSFPTTVGGLVTGLCTALRVDGTSSDTTPLARNPFSGNVTCRQVMRWAAERGCGMYYINPVGTLAEWYPLFDSEPPLFLPSDIEDGSVSLNDYKVPSPDYLEIRTTDERIYTDGSGDVRYVISGNPFYQIGIGTWPTVDVVDFPEYDPCQFGVINADPSYGYGDIFTFIVYDRQGNQVSKIGFVMKETLTFDGRTHAVYESTGNEIREDNQNYGNNTLTTVGEKSAEFYSSGGWVGYRLRNYMVLTRIVDISNVDVTYQWGNVFTGDNQNPSVPQLQYPVTFIEQPVCVAQMVSSGGSDGWLSTATDFTTQDLKEYTPAYEVNRGTSRTGISFQVHFYVMGLIY